ncbi:MAG: zinc-binding dehydrogenase [Pirellulaceae bacterium]
MDSRSLAFVEQTLAATKGAGVDAVLNSLPGEAIAAGLSLLKVGGSFLEIGKRDIYSDAALSLYPFRNNLALFAIDLDQLFKQRASSMGDLLRDLVERFDSGQLQALPTQSFTADETRDAFRLMQQGSTLAKWLSITSPLPARCASVRHFPFPSIRMVRFGSQAEWGLWLRNRPLVGKPRSAFVGSQRSESIAQRRGPADDHRTATGRLSRNAPSRRHYRSGTSGRCPGDDSQRPATAAWRAAYRDGFGGQAAGRPR